LLLPNDTHCYSVFMNYIDLWSVLHFKNSHQMVGLLSQLVHSIPAVYWRINVID